MEGLYIMIQEMTQYMTPVQISMMCDEQTKGAALQLLIK